MDAKALQSTLGSNITRFRQSQSLTVEQLAEKAKLSTVHLMNVVHGRKWVSPERLARIADALSVPVMLLFAVDENAQRTIETALADLSRDLAVKVNEVIVQTAKEHMEKR